MSRQKKQDWQRAMPNSEFDGYSSNYEDLLRDPIRDRFAGGSQFFHTCKRDLILDFWRKRNVDLRTLSYLDLGCGKGELLHLLKPSFGRVAGCDPSAGMIDSLAPGPTEIDGVDARLQPDPSVVPFDDGSFDFVTAVCVYHHVPVAERARLTREVKRVLKPGGIFCIVEHNPYNPVTRLIVSRTPIDANAILLPRRETRSMLVDAGFSIAWQGFFLFCPEVFYRRMGRTIDQGLSRVPLGGQYAVFGQV